MLKISRITVLIQFPDSPLPNLHKLTRVQSLSEKVIRIEVAFVSLLYALNMVDANG